MFTLLPNVVIYQSRQTITKIALMLIIAAGGLSTAMGQPILEPGNDVVTQTGDDTMLMGSAAAVYKRAGGACIVTTRLDNVPTRCRCTDDVVAYGTDQQGLPWYRLHLSHAGTCPGTSASLSGSSGCLVGVWNWSFTGGSSTVTVSKNGTVTDGRKSGTWRLADAPSRRYNLVWPDGVDTVTLAPNCQTLSGSNNSGVSINASKSAGRP